MSEANNHHVIEEFWGVALTKNSRELKWDVEDNDAEIYSEKSLELRQACLGAGAKEGERNVVDLTTDNDDGDAVTHTVVSMRVGGTEQSTLFLTLRPPVQFKLVEGTGPVHIVGQINDTIDVSMMSSEEEDDDEEEEEEETGLPQVQKVKETKNIRKRPATSPSSVPAKIAKTVPGDMNNWGDESDDSEDGLDSEDVSDEEEEEEEEEDDSEEDIKPPPRKSQANGKAKNGTAHTKKSGKLTTSKTPQPSTKSGGKQKGSRSAPTTPKMPGDKKKTPGKGVPDLDEIKQRLTKMSVPKKLEKFNNFVTNSFKIKDDSVKKQLWEFVQKK